MKRLWLAIILIAAVAIPSDARQDHVLCSQNPVGPFLVTSGAPYTVAWIMSDTATENGITVPNRYNGFYYQVDGGAKVDIGMATASPACSASSLKPGDIPYTYRTPSGVARGAHTAKISAWSFTLDGVGNPTTTKQESIVTSVPFTAGDPILFGPPLQPTSVMIVK
ncbi:MAG: hypothetical protein ABWY25_10275 [Paenisporosarcina sp.]